MKVAELRAELTSRGVDTKGTKPVLLARLKEAMDTEEPQQQQQQPGVEAAAEAAAGGGAEDEEVVEAAAVEPVDEGDQVRKERLEATRGTQSLLNTCLLPSRSLTLKGGGAPRAFRTHKEREFYLFSNSRSHKGVTVSHRRLFPRCVISILL